MILKMKYNMKHYTEEEMKDKVLIPFYSYATMCRIKVPLLPSNDTPTSVGK